MAEPNDEAPKPAQPRARRPPLRVALKRAWARIRGGELTPARAFWSVAIGIFIGVLPTPGLHIFMVLGVCVPLRLDAAVSYVAANISIPPIAPFLWIGSIQIGSRILDGHFVPFTAEDARALVAAPGPLLAALALGAVVLGAGLGLAGGGLAYWLARMRKPASGAEETPLDAAITRTAERFRRASKRRGTYYYVRGKLRGDPSSRAIALRGPLGDVLDLGCGRGQLAVLLLESGAATSVLACDWDEAKVALATRAADGLRAEFRRADVRDAAADAADTVLLIDVLHYFDPDMQDALLARAADRVRPGGRLILREASRGHGWRSFVTLLFERIGRAVRMNRGERVIFRDVSRELLPLLEARGMRCSVEPCWAGTPFCNVLLVASRPAA